MATGTGLLFWLRAAARERGCASLAAAARTAFGIALAAVLLGTGLILFGGVLNGTALEETLAGAIDAYSGPPWGGFETRADSGAKAASSAAGWILAAAMAAGAFAYIRRGLWSPRHDLAHPVSRRELRRAIYRNALLHNLAFLAALALAAILVRSTVWVLAGASGGWLALPGCLRALPAIFILTPFAQWAVQRFKLHPAFAQEDLI